MEELKTDLVNQGKIEGKDFKVEQDNLMSKLILLENDKPLKEYIYNQKGASKEDFETVREFGYPLNKDVYKRQNWNSRSNDNAAAYPKV